MENKDEIIASVNSSTSPRSKISDLLPSDILEEIGVSKIHKNPKVSVSSNNLKYDTLNDDEINGRNTVNNNYGSSKFVYRSNINTMEIANNFKSNNFVEYIGKVNNYPKFKNNYPSSSNQILLMNNFPVNNNMNIPNINSSGNSNFYFNKNNNNFPYIINKFI